MMFDRSLVVVVAPAIKSSDDKEPNETDNENPPKGCDCLNAAGGFLQNIWFAVSEGSGTSEEVVAKDVSRPLITKVKSLWVKACMVGRGDVEVCRKSNRCRDAEEDQKDSKVSVHGQFIRKFAVSVFWFLCRVVLPVSKILSQIKLKMLSFFELQRLYGVAV